MDKINLIDIWKTSGIQQNAGKKYTEKDIHNYRLQKSKQVTRSTGLLMKFDMAYKMVVVLELLFLQLVLDYDPFFKGITLLMLVITVALQIIDYGLLLKLGAIKESDNVVENLQKKFLFFTSTNKYFIFNSAATNPLFVASGFILYYHFTYRDIRWGSLVEDPVLYLFLAASFLISFFAQRPFHRAELRELKASLEEMDDQQIAGLHISTFKKRRQKMIIIWSIAALIGLLLLLFFLV